MSNITKNNLAKAHNNKFKKFALGTAQFGMKYGVGYSNEEKSEEQIYEILNFFYENGGRWIDTASGYGNAIKKIGNLGVADFSIITKLSGVSLIGNKFNSCEDELLRTLDHLKKKKIDYVLIHDIENIFPDHRKDIILRFENIKKMGLTRKIGLSLYNYEILNTLDLECIDVVQGPLNLFDQTFLNQRVQSTLKKNKIAFHARSIFLQGLLLLNEKDRPLYFRPWEHKFKILSQLAKSLNVSILQLCLSFTLMQKNVDRIVIGVQSKSQLNEISKNIPSKYPEFPKNLSVTDTDLIHPFKWKY